VANFKVANNGCDQLLPELTDIANGVKGAEETKQVDLEKEYCTVVSAKLVMTQEDASACS
jgi:hypothetical protein